jgi:hypothetical protein
MGSLGSSKQISNATFATVACSCSSQPMQSHQADVLGYRWSRDLDGRLPIDNNQVERLMKRIAIGRKNWLFIGSLRAGIRNASLMSLVASALRMELDVSMYLESVITHRRRGTAKLEELPPDRSRANHPEAVREYREQERRDALRYRALKFLEPGHQNL